MVRGIRSARSRFARGVAVCAVLVVGALTPAHAADPTGIISGVVTDTGAGPLYGMCVTVFDRNGNYIADDGTNFSGQYAVHGLATGTYKVSFEDCSDGFYLGEWYNDKYDMGTANLVSVTDGKRTANINAALAMGSTVYGTMADTEGAPLEGICISMYDERHELAGSSDTYEDGYYEITYLRAGDYRMQFSDCNDGSHRGEWYNDKPDFRSADIVHVPEGDYIEVNAELNTCVSPQDTDGDRLTDCDETYGYGTDPQDADMDGDLFGDGYEVIGGECLGQSYEGGSDPKDPRSTPLGENPLASGDRFAPATVATIC